MKMIRMLLELYGITAFQKDMLVGHVPLKWSKVASKFLKFTNCDIRVEVTGKTANHCVALRTKNTCNLFFYEDA